MKNIPLIISLLCVVITTFLITKSCNGKHEIQSTIAALNDSLTKERDINGKLTVGIQTVNAENLKMLGDYGALKGENLALKQLIDRKDKEYKKIHSAFILYTTTTVKLNDSLHNTITNYDNLDSAYKELITKGLDKKMPIYKKNLDSITKWMSGNILMGYDTTSLDITFKNDFEGVFGDKKIGWFKSQNYADVTSTNPYTDIKTLRVYDGHAKPRYGRIAIISGIAGVVIGFLIH